MEQQILSLIVVTGTATNIKATIAENSEKFLDPNTTAIEHQDATTEINNTGAISTDAKLCKDINKGSKNPII
ncbi:hypothetical protein [Wolbachia endosymbiont of Tettigetta isshikii]|uniref:hypothetical protein n=1 Tax=Wolbachia endosymbiont of Tettigetta isshikii TaxID=3239093 RepID=UPI00397E968D